MTTLGCPVVAGWSGGSFAHLHREQKKTGSQRVYTSFAFVSCSGGKKSRLASNPGTATRLPSTTPLETAQPARISQSFYASRPPRFGPPPETLLCCAPRANPNLTEPRGGGILTVPAKCVGLPRNSHLRNPNGRQVAGCACRAHGLRFLFFDQREQCPFQ